MQVIAFQTERQENTKKPRYLRKQWLHRSTGMKISTLIRVKRTNVYQNIKNEFTTVSKSWWTILRPRKLYRNLDHICDFVVIKRTYPSGNKQQYHIIHTRSHWIVLTLVRFTEDDFLLVLTVGKFLPGQTENPTIESPTVRLSVLFLTLLIERVSLFRKIFRNDNPTVL